MKTTFQLLASHARDIIERINSKPAIKISAHVAEWNTGVEQAGLTGVYDFPSDYKRKAHLVQDLVRCAEQLEAKAAEALVEVPALAVVSAPEAISDLVTPVTTPVFTPVESVSGVKSNPDYSTLISLVEESTHQMKVRLFCEVTHQSEQMAELMLSRSDGFLLGAIKMFTGGNPDAG